MKTHEVLNAYAGRPDKLELTLSTNQELRVEKKSKVKNFYGRVVSLRISDKSKLPQLVEYLRNLPEEELSLVSLNFYKVINQKIDSYNLKKNLPKIENIVLQVFAEDVSKYDFENLTLIKNPTVNYSLSKEHSADCIRWYDISLETDSKVKIALNLNLNFSEEERIELSQPFFQMLLNSINYAMDEILKEIIYFQAFF